MPTTAQAFRIGLYEEHLEEGAFLYKQRDALLASGKATWQHLAELEERLEAHLDALVVGGELALETCRARALAGEAGELFMAVAVFCRQRDAASVARTWSSLDFDDAAQANALAAALKFELPDAWRDACEHGLSQGDERLVPILATACAYRRMQVAEHIVQRLSANPGNARPQTIWALSRMPASRATAQVLNSCLTHVDPRVKSNALLASLHIEPRAARRARCTAVRGEDWADIVLALAGDRSFAPALRHRLQQAPSADSVTALAVLGDVTCVRALIAQLANDELAELVAIALRWITGAELYEDVFVPEEVSEAELFDDELALWRERAERPKRPDGQDYGSHEHRLSRDPARWNDWLAAHAARFDPSLRYRQGKPYGPRPLFESLSDLGAPARLRQLAYEELCMHFGCGVPYEGDLRVADQIVRLREIGRWVQEQEAQAPAGGWL